MAVKAAATSAAMAEEKIVGEGAAATLAPTVLATMGQATAGANNNQLKSDRMAVVVAAAAAAMTKAMAAAVTAAMAAAETKAAVAVVTADPTVAEAAANVAAMLAETSSWQWLLKLQLWHIGKIVLLSTILEVNLGRCQCHMRSPGERTVTLEIMCV